MLFGAPAKAWNNFGHMEAAALAWSQLTPAAKQEATRLLKLNPQHDGWIQGVPASRRDQVAFVKAATWPDQIKSLSDYHSDGEKNGDAAQTPEASQNIGYADHFRHKYWHFIDEPFSTDGTSLQRPQLPNAQTQVAVFKKTLADKTASDDVRSYDLSWLQHLIGDLHQPLHATSRFTHAELDGDAGGNHVKISCTKCGSARELHAFWDGLLGPTSAPPQDAIDAAADLRTVDSGSTDENDWIQERLRDRQEVSVCTADPRRRRPLQTHHGLSVQGPQDRQPAGSPAPGSRQSSTTHSNERPSGCSS